MKWPRCFAALLVTLTVSLSGCGHNKFEQEVATEKIAVKLARQVAEGDYQVITTAELKALLDTTPDLVLVDAMPYATSFKKQHIAGAVQFLFPKGTMETWDQAETDGKTEADYESQLGTDKKKLVVVYCGFTACGRSHNAALWARKRGFTNVRRYPGGIFAWKGAGFPVVAEK